MNAHTTRFHGRITINPPLNPAETAYLAHYSEVIHAARPDGPYACTSHPQGDARRPHEDVPSLWCCWEPTLGGSALRWDRSTRTAQNPVEWMQYLIDTFLRPGATLATQLRYRHPHWTYPRELEQFTFNHTLNGHILARDGDFGREWTLYVDDNDVHVRNGHPPHFGPGAAPQSGVVTVTVTRTYTLTPEELWAGQRRVPDGAGALEVAEELNSEDPLETLAACEEYVSEQEAWVVDERGNRARLLLPAPPNSPVYKT